MLKRIQMIDYQKIFFSAVSGVLLSMSFPKADISWLSWIAIIPFLYSIKNATPKESAFSGLIFGLAHFISLLYWITYTLNTYGYLPYALCVPILFLLTFYLAGYAAFFSWTLTKFCKKPVFLIIIAPSLWVCLEFIRTFAFSGFPWELLGYSQYNNLHLIQIADITGVYGISFLIILINTALFLSYLYLSGKTWQKQRMTKTQFAVSSSLAMASFIFVTTYGFYKIKYIDQLSKNAPTASVSVLQGNIDQSLKWDKKFQLRTIEIYNKLSNMASKDSPDLIVWPETAAPFYYFHNKPLTRLVEDNISESDSHFLIGSPSYIRQNKSYKFYNTAYLLNPTGKEAGKYSKVHLVPFGEYVPLKKFLPFIKKITEQSGDFYSGKKGETVTFNNIPAGVQICFEMIFPGLSRAMVNNGALLIVNMTNDAWFGKRSAPYQHFSMIKLRAVENRRSVARAANTGISGFISPTGRILSATSLFEESYKSETIPLLETLTFYTRFGDVFALLCFPVLIGAIIAGKMRQQVIETES